MKQINFLKPSQAIYSNISHPTSFLLLKTRTGALITNSDIDFADKILKKVQTLEAALQTPKKKEKFYRGPSHFLRIRGIYFDDKHGEKNVYLDYLHDSFEEPIKTTKEIEESLMDQIEMTYIRCSSLKADCASDYFYPDHDDYYTSNLKDAMFWK